MADETKEEMLKRITVSAQYLARPQDTAHVMESIDGLGQVLGGDSDHHSIEGFVLKGQYRIVVHVMNNVSVQVRVVPHLDVVQA